MAPAMGKDYRIVKEFNGKFILPERERRNQPNIPPSFPLQPPRCKRSDNKRDADGNRRFLFD